MADIVIFGASMTAEVAKTYLETFTEHRVVGFTVDPPYATTDRFCGLPLVPWDRLEATFPPERVELLGPISYRLMNELRRDRFLEGKARSYRFISFIHPDCRLYGNEIGEHCFIGPNLIDPHVRIGANVVVWGGSYIAHHCVIGDHTFIGGDVGISGGTRIGERCFVAGHVAIREGLTIGDGCFLPLGSIVNKSLPPNTVVHHRYDDKIARVPISRIHRLL